MVAGELSGRVDEAATKRIIEGLSEYHDFMENVNGDVSKLLEAQVLETCIFVVSML
tara:strand:+ start:444 stop:611 length:168 start_codon:yes stop_codon:yes gene_type:complete